MTTMQGLNPVSSTLPAAPMGDSYSNAEFGFDTPAVAAHDSAAEWEGSSSTLSRQTNRMRDSLANSPYLSSSPLQQNKTAPAAQAPTTIDDAAELDQTVTGPAIEQQTKEQFPNIEKPMSNEDVAELTAKIPSTLKDLYPNLTKPEYQQLKAAQRNLEQEIYSRVYNQAKQEHPDLTQEQFNKTAASIETAHLQKEYPNLDLSNLTFREAVKLETFTRIQQAYPDADQKVLKRESEQAIHDIKWQVHDYFSNYSYLGMKMTKEEYDSTMNNLAWGICQDLQAEQQQYEVTEQIYKDGGVGFEDM